MIWMFRQTFFAAISVLRLIPDGWKRRHEPSLTLLHGALIFFLQASTLKSAAMITAFFGSVKLIAASPDKSHRMCACTTR